MFRDFQIAYLEDRVALRERRRMSFVRQGVSYTLGQTARKIPHAAGNIEFDVTPVYEYGQSVVDELSRRRGSLTEAEITRKALHKNFSAFYTKSIAHVLHHMPCLNAFLENSLWRNGGTLFLAEDINLGFTVHTKFGVVRPFIHNPHLKDLATVSAEMRTLTRKTRRTDVNYLYVRCVREYLGTALRNLDLSSLKPLWLYLRHRLTNGALDPEFADVPLEDQLQPSEFIGTTSTLANIGMSIDGHQTLTCVPLPEVFMWGLGNVRFEPRVVDGEVVPRRIMTVCISFDHRALDGGDVFDVSDHLNRYFQNPELIFNWKPGDPI
jgi:pyruvate/2-oxoglutarate dehydrogenase complex dihydrolipoamide acyltransferase (E2) component